eukprot:TRINITY_DN5628_c0_g2_i3.p1 TRINITY_DN5628_c0_g2~~TRINITY_DN5628_c0_g2_i3.p1  ORF type:complete len:524 (-),score=245.22 TRINITY_DN5628_c0_g2_i3:352-1923(-)
MESPVVVKPAPPPKQSALRGSARSFQQHLSPASAAGRKSAAGSPAGTPASTPQATSRRTSGAASTAALRPLRYGEYRMRAVHDYTAHDDTEASFSRGERILITDRYGLDAGGWWKGELNGVVALFPSNLLEQESSWLDEERRAHEEQQQALDAARRLAEENETRRDMYGFKMKAELHEAYADYMADYMLQLADQIERFDKFAAVFKDSLDRGLLPPEPELAAYNFNELVRRGIPTKYRVQLWLIFAGVKSPGRNSTTLVDSILNEHTAPNPDEQQIEKDIARTFAGAVGSFSRDSLRRVLEAFSWKHPEDGYCQSMNFIAAGFLTIGMGEDDTYNMLTHVVDKLLPNYFDATLFGSRVDARLLSLYVKKRIPRLHKQFSNIGFNISVLCIRWFMCLFITTVPTETAFRIWDSLFLLGPKVLFEVALALLKLNERRLLTFDTEPDAAVFLNLEASRLFDCSQLFEELAPSFMNKFSITSAFADSLKPLVAAKVAEKRVMFRQQVEREAREAQELREQELSSPLS